MIDVDLFEGIRKAQAANPTEFRREDGDAFQRGKTTISASAIGMCARRIVYERSNANRNAGNDLPYGIFDRGNAIEEQVVKRIRQYFKSIGLSLLRAGEGQQTIVLEPLSATPDGIIVNTGSAYVIIQCSNENIILQPGESCAFEAKSIDPRTRVRLKDEHEIQCKTQIALIAASEFNEHKPVAGIVAYFDCADLNRGAVFSVQQPTPDFVAAQTRRAEELLRTTDAGDAMPEGKYLNQCDYCPFTVACGEAVLNYMPDNIDEISPNAAPELDALIGRRETAAEDASRYIKEKKQAEELIKKFLHDHDTKKCHTDDYSVSWTAYETKGRLNAKKLAELYPQVAEDKNVLGSGSIVNKLTITPLK